MPAARAGAIFHVNRYNGKFHGDIQAATEMEHHSNIVPWQMCCENTESIIELKKLQLEFPKLGVSTKKFFLTISKICILSLTSLLLISILGKLSS